MNAFYFWTNEGKKNEFIKSDWKMTITGHLLFTQIFLDRYLEFVKGFVRNWGIRIFRT